MSETALRIAEKPARIGDEKTINFRRLGVKRVNRLLRDLGLVGNLSNRSAYSFSEGDVEKMFGKIEAALATTKAKFTPSYRDQDDFSF
jgi:hypothetical protein